jgi:uncharacterized protein
MKTSEILLYIILPLLLALLLIWLIAGIKVADRAFSRRYNPLPGKRKYLVSPDKKVVFHYDWEWLKSVSFEKVFIDSFDGTRLCGHQLINPQSNHRYILACHGYRGEWEELSIPCRFFYEQMGYSLLMIEQRAHGESGYPIICYGSKERLDIVKWADYLVKNDPQAEIVLYGLSMGAASSMMALTSGLTDHVKCCIEDCGYSNIKEEIEYTLKNHYHLKAVPFFSSAAQLIVFLRYGLSLTRYSPVKSLKKNNFPIMMIHGDIDTYVPFYMLDKNYDAVKEGTYKEKHVFVNTWHAMSFLTDLPRYQTICKSFIVKFIK